MRIRLFLWAIVSVWLSSGCCDNINYMKNEQPIEEHIKEIMDPLIATAREEQLSNTTHVTHPDGTVEFIPQR